MAQSISEIHEEEIDEYSAVVCESSGMLEGVARQLLKENKKLREENELKKDAWCPELILTDLYENTNYKDPSITIKEYIQKIEAENEELKEENEKLKEEIDTLFDATD